MNKTCAACGAPLAEGAKFCVKCGTPVPVEASSPSFCPNCGEKVQAGAQFCSKCGAILSRGSTARISQNRIPLIMQDDTGLPSPQTGWLGFKGRMNREPFVIGSLVIFILTFIAWCLLDTGNYFAIFLSLCLVIPSAVSSFSMNVRRLHDLNHDGMLVLLSFVPLVNIGMFIYLAFAEGTNGANKYGLDPLDIKRTGKYICPNCGHQLQVISLKPLIEFCDKCGWGKDDSKTYSTSKES